MYKVLVIGAQNIDIFSKSVGDLVLEDSNPAKISLAFGGVGRNIAVNLCRLGFNVHLISAFGDDDFSKSALSSLNQIGVDASHSLSLKNQSNSIFLGILDKENDLHMGFHDMAIVDELTPEVLEKKSDFIHSFETIVVDNNLSAPTIGFIIHNFADKTLIIDAVSALKVDKLNPYLNKISVLKVNKLELDALSELSSIDAQLDDLHKKGANEIVLTQKGEKIVVSTLGKRTTLIPKKIHQVVNSSGAGDAFLSGYIYGMIHNYKEENKIKLANIAARITLASNESTSQQLSKEILEKEINE